MLTEQDYRKLASALGSTIANQVAEILGTEEAPQFCICFDCDSGDEAIYFDGQLVTHRDTLYANHIDDAYEKCYRYGLPVPVILTRFEFDGDGFEPDNVEHYPWPQTLDELRARHAPSVAVS